MSAASIVRLRQEGHVRPAELGELRRVVIGGQCPVLLDAAEVAVVLDISERAAWERFDNMVMGGDRCLMRAAEVRPLLLAMRPKEAPKPERLCFVCDVPLEPGLRRFCSKAHERMSLSARARYREEMSLKNARISAGVSDPSLFAAREGWGESAISGVSATLDAYRAKTGVAMTGTHF